MKNIKLNQIFMTLTVVFFLLGCFNLISIASGLETPNTMGLFFSIAKNCMIAHIITKIIGKVARNEF